MIIPRDLNYVYSPHQAMGDILKMTEKYNWSKEEKELLIGFLGQVRRTGFVHACREIKNDKNNYDKLLRHESW
jgi:hypothetical protein